MNRKWGLILGAGVALVLLIVAGVLALNRPIQASAPAAGGPAGRAASAAVSSKAGAEAASAKALFAQAERAREGGDLLQAKQLYQQILQQAPTSEVGPPVQQRLGEVNLKLILSPRVSTDAAPYVIQSGDTLSKIARQFHTTVELLKISNALPDDRIRPGQRLKVTKASFSLIVDKSQNTLTLKNGEEVLKVYRCATGKEGITPAGTFKIVNRIVDPPWYSHEGVIPFGDPRNVLGSRWLGFDVPGYGIHGTTDPTSIGKPVTKGCVRLTNYDVEELFNLLPEGTPVSIVE